MLTKSTILWIISFPCFIVNMLRSHLLNYNLMTFDAILRDGSSFVKLASLTELMLNISVSLSLGCLSIKANF